MNPMVILFGVIFICFIWTGLYFIIQGERQREIDNAFKETGNYARMFEEHTVRTIAGLDQIALLLKYQVEKEGLRIDLRRLINDERFSGQPFVVLAVLDKNGELVASSQEIVSRINNSDLEFFQVHRTMDSGQLFVGKPHLGRASGKWLIQLSRRINLPDGSFGGVVVVGVNPYYFAHFYKQVDMGENSVITLVGRDGIVRVRQSGEKVTFGLDLRQRLNSEFSHSVAGHYMDISIGDQTRRLFNFRNLAEYPLTVVVGASEEQVFQDLDRRVTAYYSAGAALSGLVLLFVALLLRSVGRRERLEAQLRQSEERFRHVIRSLQFGVVIIDAKSHIILEANPKALEMIGGDAGAVLGSVCHQFICPADSGRCPVTDLGQTVDSSERILLTNQGEQLSILKSVIKTVLGEQQVVIESFIDISQRKQLEERVRQSEKNFDTFFNTIHDLVFVLDMDGNIIHMNRTACSRLDYTEGELVGQSVLMVHPEQQRAEAGHTVQKMLAGTADSCPIPLISKSGKLIPVETWVVAGTWSDKPALFGVSKDLSALKMSEEKLAKVFEATSALMIVSTLEEGILLDVNQAFLSTLGFDRAEVIGKRSVELHIFEHPETRDNLVRTTQREGAVHNQEVQLLTKDGSLLFGLFSAAIVEVAGQRLLITTVNDVTQLKLVEQKLQEREADLLDSKQKMAQMIEGTKMGTWEWNIQTGETVFNERWAEIIGYTLDELKPTSIATWQRFAHPEDLIESRKMLQDIFEGRSPYYSCDSRMLHKDGRWLWVFDSGKVTKRDEAGNPLLMSGTHLDITLRKQTEAALQDSEQRYRALMHQAHEAVLLFDLDTLEIVEVNAAFEKMTGHCFPFAKPLHIFDLIADEPVNIMRYLDEMHTNGVLRPTLRKIRTRAGGIREVERTGTRIDIGGRQYQFTVFRDVTKEMRRQREMQADLVLAAQVQRVLLPAIPRSGRFKISTIFEPQGFVSGDVYFLEWLETAQVLRGFLVDITGHGLATALQTAAVNVLLHQMSDLPQQVSLSERLSWMNRRIPQYIDESSFAAAICFELDFGAAQLRYASAGINYFLHNGERIEVAGMYLGIRDDETYELHCRPIRQGDAVCFLTDGISDVFDRENNWGTIGAGQLCSLFHEGTWTEKTQDDATAVCIEVT